jgi:phosphoglycerate kinase
MAKRSITSAEVADKRVLVRVDFNVPLTDGQVADDTRIRASLPTINNLLTRGARVILVTHLGRPRGKVDSAYSLAPVARRLSELLHRDVLFLDAVTGPGVEQDLTRLPANGIALLENVRFEPGEETNDFALAQRLARLADIYVNDAFGAAHRAHASTVGVAQQLPAYAGLLLQQEVEVLSRLLNKPERPYVAILGGAKVSDKLSVVGRLLDRVDALLIGGGMANTFLVAQSINVGRSLVEPDRVAEARAIIDLGRARGVAVHLPNDVVVAASPVESSGIVVPVSEIPADTMILDIGPATVASFAAVIGRAKTVFWNGPLGVFERPPFAAGTRAIATAVARAAAFTVVGGGDSVAAVEQCGVADRISHISTGGGASLEFLEGRDLPGISVLPDA